MGSNPPARFLAEALDLAAESRERDLFPVVGFGTEAAAAIGAGWPAPEEDSPPAAGTAPDAAAHPYQRPDPDPGQGEGQGRGTNPHSRNVAPPGLAAAPQIPRYSPGPSKPQLPEAGDSPRFAGSFGIRMM